jgi:hypothetical protein
MDRQLRRPIMLIPSVVPYSWIAPDGTGAATAGVVGPGTFLVKIA